MLPLYLRCLIIRSVLRLSADCEFTPALYVTTPLSHASPINRTKCTHSSNESNTDEHVTPCHQPNLRQRVFCTPNLIIPPLTAMSLEQIATKRNSKPTEKQKYPRFRRAVCYNATISGCYPRYCVPLWFCGRVAATNTRTDGFLVYGLLIPHAHSAAISDSRTRVSVASRAPRFVWCCASSSTVPLIWAHKFHHFRAIPLKWPRSIRNRHRLSLSIYDMYLWRQESLSCAWPWNWATK